MTSQISTTLVYLTCLTAFIFLMVFSIVYLRSSTAKKLILQAKKRNGKLKKGGLFSSPLLTISMDGFEMQIYMTPASGGQRTAKTVAQVQLCDLGKHRSSIYTNIPIQKWKGETDRAHPNLITGNSRFDDTFQVLTNNPQLAQECLTPEVQISFLLFKRNELSLSVSKLGLQLEMFGHPRNEQEFDAFIETAVTVSKKIDFTQRTENSELKIERKQFTVPERKRKLFFYMFIITLIIAFVGVLGLFWSTTHRDHPNALVITIISACLVLPVILVPNFREG